MTVKFVPAWTVTKTYGGHTVSCCERCPYLRLEPNFYEERNEPNCDHPNMTQEFPAFFSYEIKIHPDCPLEPPTK